MDTNHKILAVTMDHLDLTTKSQTDAVDMLEGIKQMVELVMALDRPPLQTRKDLLEYVQLCIESQRQMAKASQSNREALILLLQTYLDPEGSSSVNNLLKDL